MAEYKADEGKLKEVCSILKAVLTSFGGELPIDQIDSEYRTVVGKSIPYRDFQHGSLASFLQSIPSVLKLVNRGGRLIVNVVNDENISLILHQVKNQNNSKYNKTVQKKRLATRQLHATPGAAPLLNTRWQNTVNWYNTPQSSRQAGLWGAQPIPETKWRPARPQTPPFQINAQPPRNKATNPPPGFQSKATHPPPGFPPRTTTTGFQSNESMRTKSPVPEKTSGKKTCKQQLKEAIEKLEPKKELTGDPKMQLQFKSVPCGKKMEWCSVITIGELRISSYPDLTKTREAAEEAASKKALEILPLLHKKKQQAQLPASTDYTASIRLVQKLLECQSGKKRFWWDALQDMYREKYNERLPQDWLSTVRTMSDTGLVFDNPCVDKWTVALGDKNPVPKNTAKTQNTKEPPPPPPRTPSPSQQNGKTDERSSTPSDEKPRLPPIVLPATPTWDVFITCVEEDCTVQLLLVGEHYSDLSSELVTEMELHYMEEKNQEPVKEPVVGDIYIASHEESWLRVELVEVLGDDVKVKFVDHGDIETIALSNLYYLQNRFFSLPAQALRCCLAGLEDAPQEDSFKSLMETLPMGKTLVARVQRRQEPYAIVLFDTSTNEDINLNEKVFDHLALNLKEPTLPQVGGLAEVYLIHVSSDGTLYVQIESKTYKILEDLLKIAKRRTEEMLGEKVQVDLTKLYLARFSEDGDWYRAAPRSTVDPDGKALPCCLHNVPNNPDLRWTTQACERLINLASPDTPLLLKVVSEGTQRRPPLVQLFKRLMPQNELVSINDTLGIDTSLFGSEGDSNNNSVEKDVVVSQLKSQDSSCASGTSSRSLPSNLPRVGPESFPSCFPLSLNDIPEVSLYFDVFVTFAANPNHFAVQPWKMSRKFDGLSESIQNYYHDPANLKNVMAIESGQYCAVKHSDEVWYRAKVEVVMDKSVAGIFVDYGDRFFTTLDKVQPLTPAFCTVPCLAIKAELFGIKAANKDWTPEDACRFRELAGNKNLVSVVFCKTVTNGSCINLSLVLIDTSDKTVDSYINQLLVDEGRAVFID